MKAWLGGRVPFEIEAALLALFISTCVVATTLGFARLMDSYEMRHAPVAAAPEHVTASPAMVDLGRHLFLMNCAHCHAADATGDEGPNLHGVKKSDERITTIIQKGIKGEMPKFGQKLKDADVQELIAYLRSLK